MGTESLKPAPGHEYSDAFEIEHYQRPLEDYFSAVLSAGFTITGVKEPRIPIRMLQKFPGYREMTAHPIALIIQCKKN